MRAKIISVHNHGDFDKEYVLITILDDCDIGRFVLADSTYSWVDLPGRPGAASWLSPNR